MVVGSRERLEGPSIRCCIVVRKCNDVAVKSCPQEWCYGGTGELVKVSQS